LRAAMASRCSWNKILVRCAQEGAGDAAVRDAAGDATNKGLVRCAQCAMLPVTRQCAMPTGAGVVLDVSL
jgi:hypothetical protein